MIDDQKIAYLDNAATMPMPDEVLEVIDMYYHAHKVNVHRGMYRLAHQVTEQYEAVRQATADFINAQDSSEIIFTSGTTDALNLVAFGYAEKQLQSDDEIIISVLEHHSNFIPWQRVARKTGAKLKIVGLDDQQNLDMQQFSELLTEKTKLVAITLVSNVLGSIVDAKQIIEQTHHMGGVVVLDAAQAVGHLPLDVQKLDADFLAFSGHKMYGPTGVGVLYGKRNLLEQVEPLRFGGEMADEVDAQTATFQPLPLRLEAGTPNIAGVLGLGAAIRYLQKIGFTTIQQHEQQLLDQLYQGLQQIPAIKVYGPQSVAERQGVLSFNYGTIHAHDVATIIDTENVAVRAGHMCAEPLMQALGVSSVVRASVSYVNTTEDIEQLLAAMNQVGQILL
ncbi:cysteine desulfurase [Pediococcus pentosaceus]|jgi:cysteine desulfurase/selenocysteine lyase|uniref:cysteine desulfurase n=1 Tax=Pediococcus pentosaceus TaxID=1255 RepID=UPI0006D89ABF|nr:cysteine desulfurase [Pediococcus pentosaceus]ASC08855.1 Cysteine desulfurase [Pediococcus pentosaceus]KQB82197.1 cysteine sulfinate desulfinase [Pediococcus pentosaceus]MBF7113429.1 cysteine desulfurase [Pediococcus pentosaceus]MBY4582144.1 cysteine desulfurase [Pediococcus pentosaceus]MCD5257475.1 cysteine desulfurase [Pediococcus pentosaceus]